MRIPLAPRPIRVAVAVAVAGLILVSSVTNPPEGVPVAGPFGLVGLDKWLHGVAYATLAGTVAYAVPARSQAGVVVAVGVAVGFGFLIEAMQFGLPYRTADLVDGATNAVGAVVAGAVWLLLGVGTRLEPALGADDRSGTE